MEVNRIPAHRLAFDYCIALTLTLNFRHQYHAEITGYATQYHDDEYAGSGQSVGHAVLAMHRLKRKY